MFYKTRKRFFHLLLVIALVLIIFTLNNITFSNQRANEINYNISEFIDELIHVNKSNRLETDHPRIFLFNLSRPLEPLELYDSIKCRKSIHNYVRTMLCVHNVDDDIHVSGSIWRKLNSFLSSNVIKIQA
jgi:hypothetical protein